MCHLLNRTLDHRMENFVGFVLWCTLIPVPSLCLLVRQNAVNVFCRSLWKIGACEKCSALMFTSSSFHRDLSHNKLQVLDGNLFSRLPHLKEL